MTSLPSDDTTADRLRAALRDTADDRPVGAPPAFSWETPMTAAARVRRRPAVRIARVVAPFAVAAATAAALVLPGGDAPADGRAPVAAAPVDQVATPPGPSLVPVALLTPGSTLPMAPGQYRYQRETGLVDEYGEVGVTETWEPQDPSQEWTQRQSVIAADGTVQVLDVRTAACGWFRPDGLPPEEEAKWIAHSCDNLGTAMDWSSRHIAALPTDPAALYDRLGVDTAAWRDFMAEPLEGDDPSYLFRYATTLVRGVAGLSQPVSAALEQAIAMIPGIQVQHDVANPAGERGTSYSMGEDAHWNGLLFDGDGNFIGGEWYTIEVGPADAPLDVPAELAD